MSATPRTKEQVLAYRTEDGSEIVHASFAAALEIELADANAECDLNRTRLASLFWSGALDKYTGGDVQRWAEEYTSERARLRAEVGRLLERIDGERGYSIEVENELEVLREKVSELEDNLDVARHRLDEAEGDAEQMEKDLNFKISELEDLLAEAVEERK
jgi:chromosome segregation ATPase